MRWELHEVDGVTSLVFTHTFDDEGMAARVATGWDVCFDSLDLRLAGQEPKTFAAAYFDALFDDYARVFGPAAAATKRPGA